MRAMSGASNMDRHPQQQWETGMSEALVDEAIRDILTRLPLLDPENGRTHRYWSVVETC
jgi:hypothetical protein